MLKRAGLVRYRSIAFNGTNSIYLYSSLHPRALLASNTPTTTLALLRPTGSGENGFGYVFVRVPISQSDGYRIIIDHNSGAPRVVFGLNSTTANAPIRIASDNSIVYNKWNWIGAVYSGGVAATGLSIYMANDKHQELKQVSSYSVSTDGSGSITADTDKGIAIGNRDGQDRTFSGDIAYIVRWNVALTQAELVKAQKEGPYSVRPGNLVFLWAGGVDHIGGRTATLIVGSALGESVPGGYRLRSAKVIPLRGFTVSADLLGTSSTSFSTSGTLTGFNLRGSSAVTFSSTAAGNARNPISGATSLAIGTSAILVGQKPTSGSAAVQSTASGLLRGSGIARGATNITFAASAQGQVGAAGAAFGATALAFGGAGNLFMAGRLQGAATLTFVPVLTRFASGALAGSAAISTTVTAIPSGIGSAPLSGAANMQFGARFITILCRWNANTSFAFTTQAELRGVYDLRGSAAMFRFIPSATGQLSSGNVLFGSAALAFSAGATGSRHNLRGASALTFGSVAVCTGIPPGVLAGATSLSFAAQANMTLTAPLVGTSALMTSHFGRLIEWTPDFIVGSSPISFSVTPDLKGVGALAGTIIFRFVFSSRWGVLSSQSNIAGTLAIAFGGQAISQASGDLAGSSSLQFSAVSSTTQQTNTGGVASLQFGLSGLFGGGGILSGVSLPSFTTSMDSSGNVSGALMGLASLSFSGAILPAASGSLAGGAEIKLGASGAYTLNIDMGGGSSLSITPNGLLSASGALAGAAPLLVSASGGFIPQSDILGSGDLAISASGDIVGFADTQGTSPLNFGAAGNLLHVNIFPLVGAAQLAFAGTASTSLVGLLGGSGFLSVSAFITPDFTNIPVETQEATESFIFADFVEESFIFLSEANQNAFYEVAFRGFTTSTVD